MKHRTLAIALALMVTISVLAIGFVAVEAGFKFTFQEAIELCVKKQGVVYPHMILLLMLYFHN